MKDKKVVKKYRSRFKTCSGIFLHRITKNIHNIFQSIESSAVENLYSTYAQPEIRVFQLHIGFSAADKGFISAPHPYVGKRYAAYVEFFHPAVLKIHTEPLKPNAESQKDKRIPMQSLHKIISLKTKWVVVFVLYLSGMGVWGIRAPWLNGKG